MAVQDRFFRRVDFGFEEPTPHVILPHGYEVVCGTGLLSYLGLVDAPVDFLKNVQVEVPELPAAQSFRQARIAEFRRRKMQAEEESVVGKTPR